MFMILVIQLMHFPISLFSKVVGVDSNSHDLLCIDMIVLFTSDSVIGLNLLSLGTSLLSECKPVCLQTMILFYLFFPRNMLQNCWQVGHVVTVKFLAQHRVCDSKYFPCDNFLCDGSEFLNAK